MKVTKIIIGTFFAMIVGACASNDIMPKHHLLKAGEIKITEMKKLNFAGKKFILRYQGDLSEQPVGSFTDENLGGTVNSIHQSYVVSNPGHVVFNKCAEAIMVGNGVIQKDFLPKKGKTYDPSMIVVDFLIQETELHRIKKHNKEDILLGRVKISYVVHQSGSEKKGEVEATVRTSHTKDVFELLANNVMWNLSKRI